MLIGLGGGAASSMATGANIEDLDFDSVQRGNAEIQRRAQEVIDRCWQLGEANPILSIHDVGAGGLSNALPELVHGGGAAARSTCARAERRARHVAARDLVQRGAGALRARDRAAEPRPRSRAICERERCPFAVVGTRRRTERLVVDDPHFDNEPVDMDARRAPRQAAEDDARRVARRARSAAAARSLRRRPSRKPPSACCGFRRSPTRRSSSRSATAPSAGCPRAIRWSARGRCRSPTSP